jgi:hypothetical protein
VHSSDLLTEHGEIRHVMPDTPVAPPPGGPYDPAVEERFSRLEEDVRDLKTIARDLDARGRRMEETLIELKTLFTATLPHLATKADLANLRTELKEEINELRVDLRVGLAEKPSKTYMWGILAVLLTAYACGLAALAVLK